jgi:hypothetical protein
VSGDAGLVGRHDVRSRLRRAAEAALAGDGQVVLLAALAGRQAEIDRFFGVLAGSEPLRDYLAPGNLVRLIGVRGMAGIVLGRLRADRRRARQPSHSTRTAPP